MWNNRNAGGNAKSIATWKTLWQFLTKPNIHHVIQQSHSLVFTQRELKTCVHVIKGCTWMFTPTLFIIAKAWGQSCPLVGEWINKMRYIQKVEILFRAKRNEVSSHEKI